MPFFIIVSGIFYRDKSLKENLKNIFLKLILPYLICTFLVRIIYPCTDIKSIVSILNDWFKQIIWSYSFWGDIKFAPEVYKLGVLWFFPLLASIRLIFLLIKKISKNNSIKLFFLCISITYLGYLLGIKNIWLPFSVDVAMFCIAFYYIGYLLNKNEILQKILSDNKIMIIILIIWIIGIRYNWLELAVRSYPNGAFSILTAVCGTLVILKVSQIIEKYLKYIGNILSWYGKNTINVLLLHYIEISLINYNEIIYITNNKLFSGVKIVLKLVIVTGGTIIINGINNIILKQKMLK